MKMRIIVTMERWMYFGIDEISREGRSQGFTPTGTEITGMLRRPAWMMVSRV